MTKYEEALEELSKRNNLSVELIEKIYKSYWSTIRKHIESMNLKDSFISEEDFNKFKTVICLPGFGKLYTTYPRYKCIKESYIKYIKLEEEKDD